MHALLATFDQFCVAGYLSADTSARTCCRGTSWAHGGGRHDDEPTAMNEPKLRTCCDEAALQPSLEPTQPEYKTQGGQSLRPVFSGSPSPPRNPPHPHQERPTESAAGPGQSPGRMAALLLLFVDLVRPLGLSLKPVCKIAT